MKFHHLPLASLDLEAIVDPCPLTVVPDMLLGDAIAFISQREGRIRSALNAVLASNASAGDIPTTCLWAIEEQQLVGWLNETEVDRYITDRINLAEVTVADVMNRELATLRQSDLQNLSTVLCVFSQHQVRCLPIVDDRNRLLGIISLERIGQLLREATPLLYPAVSSQVQPIQSLDAEDNANNTNLRDRSQIEKDLQQERNFAATVLDTVRSLVVVLDRQGRIVSFNKACEATTGYGFSEVKGEYFWDLFLMPEEIESVKAVFEALQNEHGPNHYENYWLTKAGKRRLIAWSNTVLRDDQGTVEYVIGTGMDITERKQVESALRHVNQELETRVQERTDQLMNLNEELLHEIAERHRAEAALRESEIRYRAIVEDQTELVCRFLPDGTLTFANDSYCRYFNQHRSELLGQNCFAFLTDAEREATLQHLAQLTPDNPTRSIEHAIALPDKTVCWQQWIDRAILNREGQIVEFQSVGRDITVHKQTEAALQQANETLQEWVSELEKRNQEMALLGEMSDFLQACLTVEEAYNALASLVKPLFPSCSGAVFAIGHSQTLVEAVATWGKSLASHPVFNPNECWCLRRGRLHSVDRMNPGLRCQHIHLHPVPAESLCVPMMAQGKSLGLLYLNASEAGCLTEAKQRLAVTVTEHIALALANLALRETLHNQSVRDALTGLFNRRYLEESLEREIQRAKRKQQCLGVVMIDIDRFKHFNDTFGHEAGNAVLRALGNALKSNIRSSDIACRYGGEELLLILPDVSLAAASQRAEQLRQSIKQMKVQYQDRSLGSITISLGVACFPDHGLVGKALIQAADAALYRAKKAGRNCVAMA